MGTVYVRRGTLHIGFRGPLKWEYRNTGLPPSQRRDALRILAQVEAELRGSTPSSDTTATVETYTATWAKHREENRNAKQDLERFKAYVWPVLGKLRVAAVRPKDIRALITALEAKGLAPRTIINTYGLARRFFADATADELMETSPCQLKRGDLPKKRDKNISWRKGALFTRDELVSLLTDSRIPVDRRLTYALGGVGGLREGEVAALRWSHFEGRDGLDCLHVTASFSRYNPVETTTKTEMPREVPVHPVLAKLINQWRSTGFFELFGRQPTSADLFAPNRHGSYRTDHTLWKGLQRDLATLGMRRRRFHDLRRTLISLARSDGAKKDVVKTITHDQLGDQLDQYTTFTWADLCEAMSCLRIDLNQTTRVEAATGTSNDHGPTAKLTSNTEASMRTTENINENKVGREGTRRLPVTPPRRGHLVEVQPVARSKAAHGVSVGVIFGSDATAKAIAEELELAQTAFERTHNKKALASRLRVLLAQLRGGK